MSDHALRIIFEPRSVAIIGASSDIRKRGNQVLAALKSSGFKGAIYPVNPKGGEIDETRVYRSVAELPEAPDLALVSLPAHLVPKAVEECGQRGIGAAVVLAVGFGESGPEGKALSAQVEDAIDRYGIRVVGPNTSGLLNLSLGLNLIGARGVREGGISLVVQSGNVALSFMNEATRRSQEGIAICVGVGNELDIGFHEYFDFLGDHEATRCIASYVEGMGDTRAFLEVAARVTRRKPIVLLKGARSESGQMVAKTHTGAVSGDYDHFRSALRQAGVTEVTRSDELFHVADALVTQPTVAENQAIGILTDGGGQGTMAADAFTDLGVPLANLSDDARASLLDLLGRSAAIGNPVDLAGAADGDPEIFSKALNILAKEPEVGGILVVGLFGGYGIRFDKSLTLAEEKAAIEMARCMKEAGKALVVHTMYAAHESRPLRLLRDNKVPVIESLDVACRALGETWRRGAFLAHQGWEPDLVMLQSDTELTPGYLSPYLASALDDRRGALTEIEARDLLSALGMSFPTSILCKTQEAAASFVAGMDSDIAMKIVSPRIPHKTEAGGVALSVSTAEEARMAYRQIEGSAVAYLKGHGLDPYIEGVLASPMLDPPVAELLIGARVDSEVGAVLTIGAGGTWVEVIKDVAHRLLPITDADVLKMLSELQIQNLLLGARGGKQVDFSAIVQAVRSVIQCLMECDEVMEVEVNPLFIYADRVQAVDACVFLRS